MAQRDSGFFQHRANANCELVFAVMATPEKAFIALAARGFHLINFGGFAMRANRLALPDLFLEKFNRRRFIAARQRDFFNRFRFFQVRRVNLHATTLNIPQGFVNRNFELFIEWLVKLGLRVLADTGKERHGEIKQL